ncbi:PKD domain-containing hypothetical protein [Phytophthora megakarya]|uniref:NHL repeat protein n=1 Tax=Phytophthora megakarya TaxID=4795 RepID=A0A225WXZ2_9STRA|nr:PKD domain-containing hypothetical protein [Phytophthora megakarya]
MELKVTPICGRDYRVLEKHGAVVNDALFNNLPSSRGICWNPLARRLLVRDVVQGCVHSYGSNFSPDAEGDTKMSLNSTQSVVTIGTHGSAPGQFNYPVAIAVNIRGEIAIADSKLSRIQIFSGGGDLEHSFGRPGTGRGEFRGLSDLEFTPRGHIAIVDSGNHRIQVITATGNIVYVLGRYGWKLGEFVNPCAIMINGKGEMFVCDEGNKRIQRLSDRGKPLLEWGSRRGSNLQAVDEVDNTELRPAIYSVFDTPCDIALGIRGEVIVCDAGKRELMVFTDIGMCLHVVSAPHIFQSNKPTAISVCSSMLIAACMPPFTKFGNDSRTQRTQEIQTSDGCNYVLAVFPPEKRVRVGRFEFIPVHCVVAVVCYLTYDDAVQLRLVSKYFHQICRRLRNEWKLYPLTPGQATVIKYNRIVSPATGLVAVDEAFQKWGLCIYDPSHRIRKYVMDFQGGFCSALSTLYGPLFCYQHEDIVRSFFRFYAAVRSTEKEEIHKTAFVEIVTQIEEVRTGYRTWEQCTPFATFTSPTQRVELPTIRTAENVSSSSGGVPIPKSLQLIENAQQHQLSKLLQKFMTL